MGPISAPMNVYPCDVSSVRIRGDPITSSGACETVSEKLSGSNNLISRHNSSEKEEKSRFCRTFTSALGRTRTCGLLIRSQTLYPAELRAHRRTHDTAGWGISQGECT
jgi:hypothetical protein